MPTKDHRRELRLSSTDDDLITEAAGLLGLSVSEFLLGRAVADAEAIVDAHRSLRLDETPTTGSWPLSTLHPSR